MVHCRSIISSVTQLVPGTKAFDCRESQNFFRFRFCYFFESCSSSRIISRFHRWNPLLKCSEAFTKTLKKKMMFLMNTQLRTTSQRKLLCFDNFIESELELTNLRHVEETVFSFGVRSWSPSWSHSGTNWNKNHLCIKSSTSTFIYFRSEAYISFKLFEHPLL